METFVAAGLCLRLCLAVWGTHQSSVLAAPTKIADLDSPRKLHWAYHGLQGPETWAEEFPECGGSRQSPINIRPKATQYDPSLGARPLRLLNFNLESTQDTFNQGNLVYNLTNTGHSAAVEVRGDMWVAGADLPGQFRTDSFHFHWGSRSAYGSEHAIGGVKYPLEMHIVNYNTRYGSLENAVNKPDGIVVLAVMFELSKTDNPEFEQFEEALRYISTTGDYQLLDEIALRWLLPTNTSRFYRYQGSLTTPGCHESVSWVVFADPVKISERQLASLRQLQYETGHYVDEVFTTFLTPLVDNWRPLQPLYGRVVRRSFPNPGNPVLRPEPEPINHVVYPHVYVPMGGHSSNPSAVGAIYNDNTMPVPALSLL